MAEVKEKRLIHRGRIFDIFKERIILENGADTELDIIRHPGASAIVPLYSSDTVVLIRQYRHAIGEYIWEIPAGTFSSGEDPLSCAKRELLEETGFRARFWKKLGIITPVPAYSDEMIHVFFAKDLIEEGQRLEKDELLEVHKVKIDEVYKMIKEGKIKDSKTIAGIFLTTLWLKDEGDKKNP